MSGDKVAKVKKNWMGVCKYANYRGCDPKTVRTAIQDGKISEAYKINVDGRKWINQIIADELWPIEKDVNSENELTLLQENAPKHLINQPLDPEAQARLDESRKTALTFTKARSAKTAIEAKIADLKYKTIAGELVDASDVEREASDLARNLRDSILNLPDKISPILAAETDINEVHELLTRELRTCLEELSQGIKSEADNGPS